MLSTLERVITLKSVGIFAELPDEILMEVAGLLEEVDVGAGTVIFQKGEPGSSLYIIIDGEVRVFDGSSTLNHLGPRDTFGEMALIDPEPRVASVEALRDTQLLRLNKDPFDELVDDRIEITYGMIKVLATYLRNRVQDLNVVREQIARSTSASP
jgi:CRP-like cAMP-binding protein